jgi:hypothetical protein
VSALVVLTFALGIAAEAALFAELVRRLLALRRRGRCTVCRGRIDFGEGDGSAWAPTLVSEDARGRERYAHVGCRARR